MKFKVRALLFLMALALAVSFIGGCKKKQPVVSSSTDVSSSISSDASASSSTSSALSSAPTTSSKTTTSSGSTKDNSFTQTAVFNEKVTNLGGVTIKLASPWNEWVITSGCPPKQIAAANAITQIAKDYNCKIEVVNVNPSTFQTDIITNFAAGKVYADIFEMQGSVVPYVPYTMDVSKVSSLELGSNGWNKFIGSTTVHRGVQYGVGFMMTQNLAIEQTLMFFNKSLADEYKLPDMYALVKNNQWTWSKFSELTKSIYDKTGGKTKGMVIQNDSLAEYLLHTNNIKLVSKTADGQYFFNYNDNNLVSGLQFWADYAKSGYILSVTGSEDFGASESKEFFARKTLFYLANYMVASSQLNPNMEELYGVLPLPKGPNASEYVSVNNTKYFCLTKDNKNIEAAGKILVAIAKRTSWNMKEWDEIQMDSALRDQASLDMMHSITNFSQIDHEAALRGTVKYKEAAINAILKQEKTPINAMTEIKGGENNEVNRIFN